jgi:predicted MFS family arabinose efflux permease
MSYGATSAFILVGIVGILRVSLPKVEQPQVTERPSVRTAMEGLFFIRRTAVLLAAISLDLFAVLFGGAVALLPAIAEKQLGVGDVAYGWLRAAVGIGSAGTAAFLAIAPLRRHVGKWLLLSVGLFGLGTIVLGWTNSYLVAFAMVVLISGADMVSVFIRSSITPLVTPDSKRGRVSAVENVFIGATNELGAFKQGALSQGIGLPATVISGGILTLGVVGVWWKKFPTLRDIDQFSDLDTPENPTA